MIFTDQIRKAIDTATRLHAAQVRKDHFKTPAISHPFGVAMVLAQYPDIPEEVVIAGLLHDILEDVEPTIYDAANMEADFGPEVVRIVSGVTEDLSLPDWHSRKAAYLNNLKSGDQSILQVSAADMIHNLRSQIDGITNYGELFTKRFAGSSSEMMWFYGERAGIIHTGLKQPIADLALNTYAEFEVASHTLANQKAPAE